ncbi:7-carboxy-7-deazaguanine synthase [Candidatus Terasakiella magnetica]|uniref:7-carboxy-7-deazaguanine synthase n=1 Tax=Candidatus Terasakiella magnetica TaxID=1867952 RepID=A0A1C3RLT2_9PROT|nr:7-carboxy-7-deazaguanine synthase QueE [Candidatus Terasakiella magnetica]SCA58280.1 7-carboxy-7-deazaguanine synthase [Candidatus Terasakiella magnetica]
MSKPINICEIFGPTIQGEGAQIGRPTVFVRTAGCDYRCSWCDTLYAVDTAHANDWRKVMAADVMAEIEQLSQNTPMSVTLSGGNPAMQPLGELIELGQEKGYDFSMETQGSLARDWFSKLDNLTLSPKPPSSGIETDWSLFKDCVEAAGSKTNISLKIVIFDEADYKYAQLAAKLFPQLPLYLQAGNHMVDDQSDADIDGVLERLRWLAEKVAQDRWQKACVLPQLHVLAWGNKRAA